MITVQIQFDNYVEALDALNKLEGLKGVEVGAGRPAQPAQPAAAQPAQQELTPGQKAAQTRARNKAKKEAEAAAAAAAAQQPAQPQLPPGVPPASEVPSVQNAATQQPAGAAAPPTMNADQLRAQLGPLCQQMGDNGAAFAGIMANQFGAAKLSDLSPAYYASYLAACQQAVAGAVA
ncbi:MAG: hypothetical protein PVI97_00310 [Candidatus Thiodiazotropha sp.]|jgi:hypothetical protein